MLDKTEIEKRFVDLAYDDGDSYVQLKMKAFNGEEVLKSDCISGLNPYEEDSSFITGVMWNDEKNAIVLAGNGRTRLIFVDYDSKVAGKRWTISTSPLQTSRRYLNGQGKDVEVTRIVLQLLSRREQKYLTDALANGWLDMPGTFGKGPDV